MDLSILRPGHLVITPDGRKAEVLEGSHEGGPVKVAYLYTGEAFGVSFPDGEEGFLEAGEVEALLGASPNRGWAEGLTVILQYVPESEEGPAEYLAETLSGTPNNVKVHGGDPDSKRAALDHLLGGLYLMGFSGAVQVDDASDGGFERYELEVPPSA